MWTWTQHCWTPVEFWWILVVQSWHIRTFVSHSWSEAFEDFALTLHRLLDEEVRCDNSHTPLGGWKSTTSRYFQMLEVPHEATTKHHKNRMTWGGIWGCRCTGENLYKFWHWGWSLQAVVWICSFALSFSSSWLLGIRSTTWRRVAGMADTVWN